MAQDALSNLAGQASSLALEDPPSHRLPALLGYEETPPPAPKIHSKNVTATDITAHFTKAAQTLPVGKLVKDDYFTLFESVGAIELMDPKMDTGFLDEGESLEDEYDVGRNLSSGEILGVMDQLLCLEMAWHMGHPLSQTVFTSLHIDHLYRSCTPNIKTPTFGTDSIGTDGSLLLHCLRAYCISLIKTCWHVNNRVRSEHYYEEEDFVTHTYNRDLCEHVEDIDILSLLKAASASLTKDTETDPEFKAAILSRLELRLSFLLVVVEADDRSSSNLRECWSRLQRSAMSLKDAHRLAEPVLEAFSVKVQRKLASTVPPRPAVIISFEDAYNHLERLCIDGSIMSEVLSYEDSQSLTTFITLFQSRTPQPSVYVRTLLQYYLFGDMVMFGTHSIRHILDDDLSALVLPANHILLDRLNDEIEVPHDPRHAIAQRMEIFRSRAAQSYLDILRTLCQNRCRIRRTLFHAVGDWDNLQLDAEDLDIELRTFTEEQPIIEPSLSSEPVYSFPLSSWAYYYKLRQMEWSLQMGFELEVYQTWELAGMYWYLSHLTSTRIRHLERIRTFTLHRFSKHKQKHGKKKPVQEDLEYGRSLSFLNFSMLEATATTGLADALSTLFTVLARVGTLKAPSLPYSDAATRYELRMKPFLAIGLPEFIPYSQFTTAVLQTSESNAEMLSFAADSASRAKKDFELLRKLDANTARCKGSEDAWKKNIKDCLRAAIMTSIGIASLNKAIEKGNSEVAKLKIDVPEQGKGYHDWWIVPKLSLAK